MIICKKKKLISILLVISTFLVFFTGYCYAADEGTKTKSDLSLTEKKIEKLKKRKYKPGSRVTIGCYPAGFNDELEPLKWTAVKVDKENGRVLLLCDDVIDAHPYNTAEEMVTWETCELRKWLNTDFLEIAFSDLELGVIGENAIYENADYKDRAFILSHMELSEADSVVSNLEVRAHATRYAYKQGLAIHNSTKNPKKINTHFYENGNTYTYKYPDTYASYLLRPDSAESGVLGEIGGWGGFSEELLEYYDYIGGIRPAIWLDLN